MRKGRRRAPRVLLPPAPTGPLPRAVPLLALLGLVVLLFYTLPAVRKQHRLEGDHARLRRAVRAAEAEVGRLRGEVCGGAQHTYLRIQATRELLHKGTLHIRDGR